MKRTCHASSRSPSSPLHHTLPRPQSHKSRFRTRRRTWQLQNEVDEYQDGSAPASAPDTTRVASPEDECPLKRAAESQDDEYESPSDLELELRDVEVKRREIELEGVQGSYQEGV